MLVISIFDQIQDILINSSNKDSDLYRLLKQQGKDKLFNLVLPLDFGLYNNLIKQIVLKICQEESDQIKKMKFSTEMSKYVSELPTKRLLSFYNKKRSNQDELFFCMRLELSKREHVLNKIESKQKRRLDSKKKKSKKEIKERKIVEKILRLKSKNLSSSEISARLRISEEKILEILNESYFVEFENLTTNIKEKQQQIIGCSDKGEPIFDEYFLDIAESVSVTKKK